MPSARPRRGATDTRPPEVEPDLRQDTCPLCGRPIPPGARASRHHLVPKLKGGARMATARLHQICHSAIHARFTEAELARRLRDPEDLCAAPELADFLGWIRTKAPGFHAGTRMSGRLRAVRPRRA